MTERLSLSRRALAGAIVLAVASSAAAQGPIGYGVNEAGTLFRFDVSAPGPVPVTEIGPVGFLPEGIDFRPGTHQLYAIDVGANTTQLYTINITTGASTPVGAGFNSTGAAPDYNLLGNQTFGFDFNPKTVQLDDSMRIRLVGTNGTNLRLNSATGQIAGVDTSLLIQPGASSPFVDGAAYINNVPETSGATTLYDMDSRNDALYKQDPPGAGTLTKIGDFGVSIDAQRNIGFDVYTTADGVNNFGFAVYRRNDAPPGNLGAWLLYSVNLTSGATTGGKLVGPNGPGDFYDFEGGFAVRPIPEPATMGLALAWGALAFAGRRRPGAARI